MKTTPKDSEKRRHYRVDDSVYFSYFVLPEGQDFQAVEEQEIFEKLFDEKSITHYRLMRKMRQIDQKSAESMTQINQQNPALGNILKGMNSKFDCLINELFLTEDHPQLQLNLSLGGLAFLSKQAIENERLLKMKLILKPHYDVLVCNGRVKRCDPALQNTVDPINKWSIAFEDLTDFEEKLLAKHIMYRQTELIRKR